MSERKEITERLAARLREERTAKGLSLDALSKLSGVSRSMLSQIERGESNPTVAVMWNLTRSLNLEFSALLEQEADTIHPIHEIMRADQTPMILNSKSGCEIRILSGADGVGGVEVYDIRFAAGAALESSPHKSGCIEHLTVLEGAVQVVSADESAELGTGDTIRYAADVEHAISAQAPARALLVVRNP